MLQPPLPGLRISGLRRRQFVTCQVFGPALHRLILGGVQDPWNGQLLWDVLFVVPAVEFLLVLGRPPPVVPEALDPGNPLTLYRTPS